MLIIGLTGGIGSGKTAVSDRLHALGTPIIDTDVIAREICEPEMPGSQAILEHFGRDFFLPNGALDRVRLRAEIFAEPSARKLLESLLHPLISKEVSKQLQKLPVSTPYVILAVPLLTSSTYLKALCHRILVIDCPEELQIARVMHRNGLTEKEVKAIMDVQATRMERLQIADDIIMNDVDLDTLNARIDMMHAKYVASVPENTYQLPESNCQSVPNGTESGDSENMAQSPS